MAINFNELPTNRFTGAAAPKVAGRYKAYIENAEMKVKKDGSGEYLNLKYKLTDADGKAAGSMYDIHSESTKAFVLWKLGRLLTACRIPLEGTMELKDIGAIIVGRTIEVDLDVEEWNGKQRYIIDTKKGECYYPCEENFMAVPEVEDDEMPF